MRKCLLSRVSIIIICMFLCTTHVEIGAAKEWTVEKATKPVTLRGYTRSVKRAVISAEVGGKLIEINYDVGDRISDLPFATIDATFIDFDIKNSRLTLSELNIRLKQVDSRIAYLKKDFDRKEKLFAKGRTTEVIRDAASQALDQAVLEREQLAAEKRVLGVTINRLLEQKRRHTIAGTSRWIVTDRKVEQGEVIQAGVPLAVIQDFREMVVPLAVSNEEFDAIRSAIGLAMDGKKENRNGKENRERGKEQEDEATGLQVLLENQPVSATIYYTNPEFDEQSRKINLKLLIHGYAGEHRGGLRCVIPLTVRSRGLKVPSQAVVNRYENPKVFIKGDPEPVTVTILDALNQWVIIADDPKLSPGTLLIDQ